MMKRIKVLFSCFCIALFQLSGNQVYGQSDETISLPAGEVFLHTNLSQYFAGESILFKAYIPDNDSNHPDANGNNLFVAVLDPEGLEVASGIFPFEKNEVAGNIGLSKFLTEGNYVLIAHTNLMRRTSLRYIFSKVIEIKRPDNAEFSTVINLTDTLYKPGSLLTAKIRFSGKERNPVPVSFDYQLTGASGEIFAGKSKSGKDGTAIISMQLPVFKSDENIKLFVTASYKGEKKNTGIVIPVTNSTIFAKNDSGMSLPVHNNKHLNILIHTNKPQYKQNEIIQVEIVVTDDKGSPVIANLSVSASNSVFNSALLYKNDCITCSAMGYNSQWRRIITAAEDTVPQILADDKESSKLSGSVFSPGLRKLYAGYLSEMSQSPGSQFNVQEKNDLKMIKADKKMKAPQKQEGYSPDRSIFDILMQIKPYHLADGKIIFASSGTSSINNQDGALIVVDGIRYGTDTQILNTIPVSDIARITASTSPMDIQRYTGLNNVGVIEIFTKKGGNMNIAKDKSVKNNNNSLLWEPDMTTNNFGKATISFVGNKASSVVISVAGITAGGLTGSKTIQLSVY